MCQNVAELWFHVKSERQKNSAISTLWLAWMVKTREKIPSRFFSPYFPRLLPTPFREDAAKYGGFLGYFEEENYFFGFLAPWRRRAGRHHHRSVA